TGGIEEIGGDALLDGIDHGMAHGRSGSESSLDVVVPRSAQWPFRRCFGQSSGCRLFTVQD
ncbi:hypothetical protein NYZ21_21500, partial [Acinetobacter baumannii]|nr:hypothetical protein [Acinetobacter baumannii]